MSITKEPFGCTARGEQASVYQLTNASGAYMRVTDYGAIIVSIVVPDRDGRLIDVALGYDSVEGYEKSDCHFGATIGRSGNRTANAAFTINGKEYHMGANESGNNLHSGPVGYDDVMWDVKEISEEENSITFGRISPDGEQGFPGNFNITVRMEFSDSNEVIIQYEGVADQDTLINMTNHSYFNLSGHDSGSICENQLQILAEAITPVADSASIPTGELRPVEGTPMDFRTPKLIGRDIDAVYDQLEYAGGFDHNYVLDDYEEGIDRVVADAYSPKTGIGMEVTTDLPGVQFYAGNYIIQEHGKNGALYEKRAGFCLETQQFPNAVNQPEFPSPVVKAGTLYQTLTIYRFYTK
ncbi:MAG: aldose epimerase family protein [Blautia sp.]|jgi:aldose 1-epimerase